MVLTARNYLILRRPHSGRLEGRNMGPMLRIGELTSGIDSLDHIGIAVPDLEIAAETYRRLGSGRWEYLDAREGLVKLASGATLDLSVLYRDLPE